MATIGSITVAFSASFEDFESGIEEVADLLDGLSESVDDINEKIEASSKTMRIKAVVDSDGVDKARRDIESKSASVSVRADAKAVSDAVESEVVKSKKKVEETKFSIIAEAKDVVAKATEAASDAQRIFGRKIVMPVTAAVTGVTEAVSAARQAGDAYSLAATSVRDFSSQLLSVGSNSNGLRNATVFAFGLTNAIVSGNEAYSSGTEAVGGFFSELSRLAGFAAGQRDLSRAVSQGAGAFVGVGVSAAAYRLAMLGVNAATEELDPKLRVAVRGFSAMALAMAQTAASGRLAASVASLTANALKSQASPLSAVSAFMRSYRDGLREMSEASTAAIDRQRALVRIQNVVSQVFSAARGTVESAIQPFATGFTRARESGEGFVSAVSRGLSGQIQSIGVVRESIASLGRAFLPLTAGFSEATASGVSFFAAIDRGLTAQLQSISLFRSSVSAIGGAFQVTGISGFFDPLITGFERARASGDGFFAASARGVAAQANSIAAYRAVRDSVSSAGRAVYDFSASIVGVNATTKIGRDSFFMLQAAVQAVRSTSAEVAAYFGVLNSSFAAFFSALPGGRTVVESLSSAFRSLGQQSGGLMSSLPGVGAAIGAIAPLMTLASVASGSFAHSLEEVSVQIQSIEQMSDRFGATTGEMQILAYAAESARVGMGQLAKATQSFYTNVSKVKIGQLNTETVQEAKFAFDRLGVSIEELRNKSPQEVFGLVAEELLKVEDPADRAAIAFDLFGKQAVNILPALKGLREAAEDSKRLGIETSKVNFERLIEAEGSFDRVSAASKSLGVTMLSALAPLQTGWNNLMAELLGGFAAAIGPMRTLFASVTVPMQVFMEVIGRIVNIFLRSVGVVTSFVAAMSGATALAPAWTAFGDVIKGVLSYLEQAVNYAQQVADVFSSQMNPAIEGSAEPLEKLAFAAKPFAAVILSAGVGSAVMQSFGISAAGALLRFAAALTKLNFATVFGAMSRLLRAATIDVVAWATRTVAAYTMAYVGGVQKFIAGFATSVVSFVSGNTVMGLSATAAGYTMAAAWVVGTLGLAALLVAGAAVYNNFSQLSDFFADFGNNIGELLTFDGLVEAGQAVVEALKKAFMGLFGWVAGFFSNVIQGIVRGISGVKTPEKIDAASASVSEIVDSRRGQQTAQYQASLAAASISGADTSSIMMPTEDVEELTSSVSDARQSMVTLSLDAARFGEAGRKAFLAARADFDKLQQRLADGTLSPERFEEESARIQANLEKNLRLADVLSPEQLQQSAESMRKTVEDSFRQVRDVMRGQDLGSDMTTDRFFPTSEEIKQAADDFAQAYQSELMQIEQRLQQGDYGTGQGALRAAEQERERAKQKFDRNMGKIEVDLSFANDIRKSLEDAFLSPVQKFEKELKKIQDNKSLTEQEKSLATVQAQKGMVESTFGKSAGQSYRDKEEMFRQASAVDQYGRTAFTSTEGNSRAGAARQSAERNKLDMERRQSVGLDANASQKLKAGADNIADVFGVTGKSMAEIQASLSPKMFAEFQEAMRKNADAAKASVGVQQPASQELKEAQDRLNQAVKDGVVSQQEAAAATRRFRDDFMSSIGVTKTPFEDFSGSIDNIAEQFGMVGEPLDKVRESLKGNAADLALFDRAVKSARDNLLASLGVEKSPQQVFEETMKRIDEAANSTDPNKRISKEEADQARRNATMKRDESLGAGGAAADFASQAAERKRRIEEAYGVGGSQDPEKYRLAMRQLGDSLPGAQQESPVQKFRDQLSQLESLRDNKTITGDDFEARKKELQAQLEQDMKPALDRLAPDRRAVEGADVRSKSGVDTFFRILRGNDNPTLKAQLEIARNTRLLAEAAAEPEAAPVMMNIQGR